MDYEKLYKVALERANIIYNGKYKPEMAAWTKILLEAIFPELAESEDERIRKRLICGMNALKGQKKETFATIPIDDCIAWLEKQAEKPKWSEEDEDNLNMAIYFMRSENTPYSPTDVEPVVEWLYGLKQRMEE